MKHKKVACDFLPIWRGMFGAESEDPDRTRFQVELEFVQCLANPNYLNYLAQRDVFKQREFVNYLKYLLYWKRAEYAKFLKYPQCLLFLELLQDDKFREAMADQNNVRFIEDQQILQWQYYIRKRMRLLHFSLRETGPTAVATVAADKPAHVA